MFICVFCSSKTAIRMRLHKFCRFTNSAAGNHYWRRADTNLQTYWTNETGEKNTHSAPSYKTLVSKTHKRFKSAALWHQTTHEPQSRCSARLHKRNIHADANLTTTRSAKRSQTLATKLVCDGRKGPAALKYKPATRLLLGNRVGKTKNLSHCCKGRGN